MAGFPGHPTKICIHVSKTYCTMLIYNLVLDSWSTSLFNKSNKSNRRGISLMHSSQLLGVVNGRRRHGGDKPVSGSRIKI